MEVKGQSHPSGLSLRGDSALATTCLGYHLSQELAIAAHPSGGQGWGGCAASPLPLSITQREMSLLLQWSG